MKYNFYMSLRTQYENLGDYLIAQATIDILKDIGDITLDIRNVPQKYIDLFEFPNNVKLVKEGFINSILFSKNKKWIYIVKPGGHGSSKNLKANFRTFLMTIYFLFAKIFFKIKVFKMSHSHSDELSFFDKYYEKIFDLNLVRDEETYINYKLNNINNIYNFSDFAMYYLSKKSKFYHEEELKKENIIISLRYDRLNDESNISYSLAKKLLEKENLNNIIYLSQVTFDNQLNEEKSKKNGCEHLKYEITNESIYKITKKYKTAKYVISNRLHVLLLALINGCIPIALIDEEKDKKIIGALKYLNISFVEKNALLENLNNTYENNSILKFQRDKLTKLLLENLNA